MPIFWKSRIEEGEENKFLKRYAFKQTLKQLVFCRKTYCRNHVFVFFLLLLRETQNALQLPVFFFFFQKSCNMADREEFRFFQDVHVRIDIRIGISSFIRPLTTKFDKQVHLQDLTQLRLIKQVLVTSLRQDHVTK